ncbi:MAG: restriction endonuclease subunit S [Oligoflexia bacterium]|nr:restriction endonuclease subunit S [Oligoflexia bacterium]
MKVQNLKNNKTKQVANKSSVLSLDRREAQSNQIEIFLSAEHRNYVEDIEKCFDDLNIKVEAGYVRKSIEELPMQVLIFLTGAISGGLTWDLIKIGIKKVLKKFKKAGIRITDRNQNTYNISPEGQMNIFLVPNGEMKVISNITSIDDLFKYLQKQNSSWQKVKLGDVCSDISYGYTASAIEKSVGPKFLRITDIVPSRINWSNVPYCKINDDNIDKYELKTGDIVIARTGATTGFNKIIKDEIKSVFASYLIRYRVNENVSYPFYIGYVLQSSYWKEFVKSIVGGSAQPGANAKQFASFEFLLPSVLEQEAIAEVLSSLDDKIELLHKQNKTLENIAQTLFHKWFIEDAKDDWEEGTFGDVVNFFNSKRVPLSKMQRDKMKQGKLYPYYGAATIMDYVNEYIFDGEYILLGEDGTVRTNKGCPILQYAIGKFWINNHAHIFQAKPPYTNFFIWLYLLKKNIDTIVTGAVQPKINQTNLKALDFPKFPVKLVNSFNKETDEIFQKMKNNKEQIQNLKNIRDILLPKLMSGKVKVKCLN